MFKVRFFAILFILLININFASALDFNEYKEDNSQLELNFFPSAREYKTSYGTFDKSKLNNIYLIRNDYTNKINLDKQLRFIVDEFKNIGLNDSMNIVYNDSAFPKHGDIVIYMSDNIDEIKTKDGFVIDIGNIIIVKAKNKNGIIYGLRAIMQQMYLYGYMPNGTIIDYPDVEERAVHIDMGRKYFSPDWIKKMIRDMSFKRLNTLQLHFSENEGFRLECETYPEVVSDKYITKKEMLEIIAYADKYGVDIIPSFDTPGHMQHILNKHKEFRLKNKDGEINKSALDINNDEARQFVKNIIKEYSKLFSKSRYFHIGGDEFIDFNEFYMYPSLAEFGQKHLKKHLITNVKANGLDGYTAYINEIADYTKTLGFIPRIWNDGAYRKNMTSHIELDKDIQICYWSRWDKNMATTQTFIDKGHKLINVSEMMYYVLEHNSDFDAIYDLEEIHEHWNAGTFEGNQNYKLPHNQILGSCYAIWCDYPNAQTEQEVFDGIFYPLSAMAEKSWAGNRQNSDVDEFKKLIDNLRNFQK